MQDGEVLPSIGCGHRPNAVTNAID